MKIVRYRDRSDFSVAMSCGVWLLTTSLTFILLLTAVVDAVAQRPDWLALAVAVAIFVLSYTMHAIVYREAQRRGLVSPR